VDNVTDATFLAQFFGKHNFQSIRFAGCSYRLQDLLCLFRWQRDLLNLNTGTASESGYQEYDA
jgi:hypothetical protein